MARAPAVQLLLDRAKVHDLQMTYARAVDRRDWDLLRTVFAKDVVARYGPAFSNGARKTADVFHDREGVVKYITGVAHFTMTYHFMGNNFIEVTGDQATMKTFAMLNHHLVVNDQPHQYNVIQARYIDKLRREGDGWVIYDRGGEPDWNYTGVTKVTTTDPAVQLLLDRAELRDLHQQYLLGIDLKRPETLTACFASDFCVSYGPQLVFTEHDKLGDFIRRTRRWQFTLHFMGKQLVELEGDTARMESATMITHLNPSPLTGAPYQHTSPTARYVDTLKRINGRWLISVRGEGHGAATGQTPFVASSTDPEVQWLLDRQQIADTITRHAWAMDRRDYEGVRKTLAPGFRYEHGDRRIAHTDAFLADMKATLEQAHSHGHFLGNQLIDLKGDAAEVETYCYVTHRESAGSPWSDWATGGRRYVDTLVRSGTQWLLVERRVLTNQMPPEKILIR